ncbi:GGDEF domain-containing protein [Xinfangfangia sp. D13-10-4-6]|uniref:GGDEF domain-containing protein n=1 Tax=Pseudogemmobacter hezensis TaxID=2737662 RepID=UPI0015559F5E|nr:sensor domain-containing diguanylate cyclase [Pseudogemmobacter hezensis]NPD14386.1 GGDEF domain-containing protein [Pseudogemmobacter hezensis]
MVQNAGADAEIPREPEIPKEILSSMLLKMFEFAPIAMSISTSDGNASRYLLVNKAYLDLTGNKWEDISGVQLTDAAAIQTPDFIRRHQTLEEVGAYVGEEVNIRHVDGTILPTLITCQRTIVDGINYDLEIIVDISSRVKEQYRQISQLLDLASTDPMSGLPNRRAFEGQLAQYMAQPGGSLILAYVDFNGFKQLNDTRGHAAGDEAIRIISGRMKSYRRQSDFVARIGGDEFALILRPENAMSDATLITRFERIFQPFMLGEAEITLGASVGLTSLQPGDTAETLLHRADQLMYAAKRARTRDGVFVCSDRSSARASG